MLLPETLKLHDKELFEFHYIYFLPWKDQMVDSLINSGGQVTCLNARNNIFLMLRVGSVVKYVKTNNIKIIHAHLPWAGIVARIVGRVTNIPVVYTEHNKQERYHAVTRIANLATMNWLTRVIAVSEDVALSIRKHKPSLRSALQVLQNGVDASHFNPTGYNRLKIKKELGIPANSQVVGTVAVFRPQKRLDLWMEIGKSILDVIPEVHFIIVGDGPLKALLLDKSSQLGISGRIHFVGLQPDIRPFLAAFDLFMISSQFEGLPIALLEAMAFGCAVVSTDAGGIKEVIRHNIDGLVTDVNQPQMLSVFAIDLLQSREKGKSLGNQARQRIIQSFSLARMVSELETMYIDLLRDTSGKRNLG